MNTSEDERRQLQMIHYWTVLHSVADEIWRRTGRLDGNQLWGHEQYKVAQ